MVMVEVVVVMVEVMVELVMEEEVVLVVMVGVVMEEGTMGDEAVKAVAVMVVPMVTAVMMRADSPGRKFPRQTRFCRCPHPSRWQGARLGAALGGGRRESFDKS